MNKTAQLQEHNALLDNPQALRQQMANDGFLFFRGLLPAAEIAALRRQILQICDNNGWIAPGTELMDGIADPSADAMEPFCGVGVPPAAYGDVQCLESFHRLAHNPRLVAMLGQLFDETVLVHALKIARLMIPAKGNAPTPAHQDHIFIPRQQDGLHLLDAAGRLSARTGRAERAARLAQAGRPAGTRRGRRRRPPCHLR